jgi:hypothetical protein
MKTSSILSNACANVTYTPNLIGREKGSAYLKEGIGYHADDMRDAIPDAEIASVSLGEERDFLLKPYSEEAKARGLVDTKKVRLVHGSLLCMKDNTQEHYKHSLPPRPKQSGVRINLTFRQLHDPRRRGGVTLY